MKIFSKLYNKMLSWSRHPHAPCYLAVVSFAESSFFPIPPDVMLAPMALAKPDRAWYLAFICTLSSVLGGIFGYLLGKFAFVAFVHPLIDHFGYMPQYLQIVEWFGRWGFWIVFVAGFSPIPYKLFTIAAGVVDMVFIPFVLASLISRGARFFMVAGLMRWGGERLEKKLEKVIDILGWSCVILILLGYLIYHWW
jgi:membrane protein YqaA with SNARE-associated domain